MTRVGTHSARRNLYTTHLPLDLNSPHKSLRLLYRRVHDHSHSTQSSLDLSSQFFDFLIFGFARGILVLDRSLQIPNKSKLQRIKTPPHKGPSHNSATTNNPSTQPYSDKHITLQTIDESSSSKCPQWRQMSLISKAMAMCL